MTYLFIFLTLALVLGFYLVIFVINKISNSVVKKDGQIKITNLNKRNDKIVSKLRKKVFENESEEDLLTESFNKKLYVLNFTGDIQASQVSNLKEEITAILQVAGRGDEVLLNLESPGGVVHGYGLAASQLDRLRKKNIKLTVCIDKVAASGGYMMASVADRIVAAPFSVIGSIGVVIEFPNFSKLLNKVGVEYLQLTAGEHKRTVSSFVENTENGIKKTEDDLKRTHSLFKEHIASYRPKIELERVATGEIWYGSQAKSLGLVDEVGVSDDILLEKMETFSAFKLEYRPAQSKRTIMSSIAANAVNKIISYWIEKAAFNQITPK